MTRAAPPADDVDLETLAETWGRPGGIIGWLSAIDHRTIGLRYMCTAFGFFVLAGLLAVAMRLQLAVAGNDLLGPDRYNQFFTTHGTSMMFLFAVPVVVGLGLYVVPVMIGTRELPFPRLAMFGYWTYLIGGILLYAGLLSNTGPDAGWFAYTPLSGPEYGVGKRMDIWAQMITFTEIAMITASVNIIVAVAKHRAPGMTVDRIPLFVWAELVTACMILLAMVTVATSSLFLASDRLVASHFFNPAEGGDALLWQHLFWFFAHPEVYIIFLPATGIVSTLVIIHSRRPMVAQPALVVSTIAIGVISFGVWVHHMFMAGLPHEGESFFAASSMLITIPTAVQVFAWIATLWLGRIRWTASLLFVFGFFFVLIRGGITGVMLASVPFDLQAHDSYFVVAHLHDVLIGGMVFPLFAAFYHWFPKWTGRLLSERLGRWQFGLFLLGDTLAFLPMHFLGLGGMPRRVYTYAAETGWQPLNMLATAGGALIAISVALFLVNVVRSRRGGAIAGDNPWGGDTLEWGTSSPLPPYNFAHITWVEGRHPLWDRTGSAPVITGFDESRREVLMTTALDAEPYMVPDIAHPDLWPFVAALATGVLFVGLIFTPWAMVVGLVLLVPALIMWGWPKAKDRDPEAVVPMS